MRFHFIQHVPYEGLGRIQDWFELNSFKPTSTQWFGANRLPEQNDFDALIIMGGPMSVYETNRYPWLEQEIHFIRESIQNAKKVLGICLGAQLIAAALGAKVYPNHEKEIGWFPVHLTNEGRASGFFGNLGNPLIPFHWHGDTFELPNGALLLAESDGCINQAFSFRHHVLALQFHLEIRWKDLNGMAVHLEKDLSPGTYVQSLPQIRNLFFFENSAKPMHTLLSAFFQK